MSLRSLSSLRGLARATQKATLWQAAGRSALLQRTCEPAFVRTFAKSTKRLSAVKEELVAALDNEITAEKKLEQETLGGTSAPSVPGFEISTKDAIVTLTKTFQSEKIVVKFDVTHTVDSEDFGEEPEESQQAEEPVPVSLPEVEVYVTKGDQSLCFSLQLEEVDQGQYDFRVNEFFIAKAGEEEKAREQGKYASSGQFIDPSLHDLLFVRYLEERGFTQDFCYQLVTFSTHYEHSRYVELLNQIKTFVNK